MLRLLGLEGNKDVVVEVPLYGHRRKLQYCSFRSIFVLFVVCGMNEIGILVVYLQDIEHHLPYEFGKGYNFSEDRMTAELLGRRHIERETDEEE